MGKGVIGEAWEGNARGERKEKGDRRERGKDRKEGGTRKGSGGRKGYRREAEMRKRKRGKDKKEGWGKKYSERRKREKIRTGKWERIEVEKGTGVRISRVHRAKGKV